MLTQRIKKNYTYRSILWDMAFKQFKEKYAGSKLGIWWAVIIPVLLALSINFVFNIVFKIDIPNYALFVLSGIIPWLFFTNALSEATNIFLVNAGLLKQATFPREFLPLACILANFYNFLLGLVALLPLFLILNYKVILSLPFLSMVIVFHLIFIIGLGLLFSQWNVFYRDFQHFLSLAFMVWFWITPVFYSLEMIPFPLRWVCLFNPMSYFVSIYQAALFRARPIDPAGILILTSLSSVSFILGYAVFIKNEQLLLKKI